MLDALGAICELMAESRVVAGVDFGRRCAKRKAKVMDHERRLKCHSIEASYLQRGILVDDKYPDTALIPSDQRMTAPLPAHVIIVSIRDFLLLSTAVATVRQWLSISFCCIGRHQHVTFRAHQHYPILAGRVRVQVKLDIRALQLAW
jgi:hypothetical protein